MFGDDDYSALFEPDPQQMAAAQVQVLRNRGLPPQAQPPPPAQGVPNLPLEAAARVAAARRQPLVPPGQDSPQPDAAGPTPGVDIGQGSSDPSYFGTLGLMASLATGRVEPFARAATQYAQQVREGEGQKLQRLLEQKRNEQLAQFHQDEVSDRQQQIGLQREEMNRSRFRPFIDPTSGRSGILDSWTGQLVNGATPVQAPSDAASSTEPRPVSTRAGQYEEKTAERYANAMSPAKAAPDLWKKLQFGGRIKPLIEQGLQSGGEMSPQLAQELAAAFGAYVANGGAPAEGEVRALLPHSFTGDIAGFSNYLSGNMSGADRSAWLNQIKASLEREEPVIQGGIREVLQHNDQGFPGMRSGSLSSTRNGILENLRKQGYLPGEEAQSAPQRAEPAAGLNLDTPVQPHPQDSVAVTWARAHLNDPKLGAKASAILKANGVQ